MIRKLLAGSCLLACLLTAIPALAAPVLLYDNGAPNGTGGNEMTEWIQAEDFVLAGLTNLVGVRFWAVESAEAYAGSITWRIYGNAGSEPDETNIIASGNVAPTRTLRQVDVFGSFDSFQYDFSVGSLALGPGTYWLGLHNGPLGNTGFQGFGWETTALNATLTGREDIDPFDNGGWFNNGAEHAFQLYAEENVIPEPASMLLVGAGLAGLAGRLRRARK